MLLLLSLLLAANTAVHAADLDTCVPVTWDIVSAPVPHANVDNSIARAIRKFVMDVGSAPPPIVHVLISSAFCPPFNSPFNCLSAPEAPCWPQGSDHVVFELDPWERVCSSIAAQTVNGVVTAFGGNTDPQLIAEDCYAEVRQALNTDTNGDMNGASNPELHAYGTAAVAKVARGNVTLSSALDNVDAIIETTYRETDTGRCVGITVQSQTEGPVVLKRLQIGNAFCAVIVKHTTANAAPEQHDAPVDHAQAYTLVRVNTAEHPKNAVELTLSNVVFREANTSDDNVNLRGTVGLTVGSDRFPIRILSLDVFATWLGGTQPTAPHFLGLVDHCTGVNKLTVHATPGATVNDVLFVVSTDTGPWPARTVNASLLLGSSVGLFLGGDASVQDYCGDMAAATRHRHSVNPLAIVGYSLAGVAVLTLILMCTGYVMHHRHHGSTPPGAESDESDDEDDAKETRSGNTPAKPPPSASFF